MRDYYWNYNDCIRSDNLEAIELALTRILEQESCCRIPSLPQPPKDLEQERQSRCQTVPNLWIVGLFPAAAGWTIVKTSPPELLCHRALGATRSRLSELAMQIDRDAFHLSVYVSSEGILMEADASGHTFISGWTEEYGPTNGKFHAQQINEQEKPSQFFLLEVPEEMQSAMKVNIDEEERRRKFEKLDRLKKEIYSTNTEERLSDPRFEMEEIEELFELEEYFDKGRFQLVDESLGRLIGGPHSYWYLKENLIYENQVYDYSVNLVYKAYTQQQQLEADGARLLYFQPAEHYRQPDAEKIRGTTSNKAETDADPEMEENIPF